MLLPRTVKNLLLLPIHSYRPSWQLPEEEVEIEEEAPMVRGDGWPLWVYKGVTYPVLAVIVCVVCYYMIIDRGYCDSPGVNCVGFSVFTWDSSA